jgi:hypothetical protein
MGPMGGHPEDVVDPLDDEVLRRANDQLAPRVDGEVEEDGARLQPEEIDEGLTDILFGRRTDDR